MVTKAKPSNLDLGRERSQILLRALKDYVSNTDDRLQRIFKGHRKKKISGITEEIITLSIHDCLAADIKIPRAVAHKFAEDFIKIIEAIGKNTAGSKSNHPVEALKVLQERNNGFAHVKYKYNFVSRAEKLIFHMEIKGPNYSCRTATVRKIVPELTARELPPFIQSLQDLKLLDYDKASRRLSLSDNAEELWLIERESLKEKRKLFRFHCLGVWGWTPKRFHENYPVYRSQKKTDEEKAEEKAERERS